MKTVLNDKKWKVFKSKVLFKWKKIKGYEVEKCRGRISLLSNKIMCKYRLNTKNPKKELNRIIENVQRGGSYEK